MKFFVFLPCTVLFTLLAFSWQRAAADIAPLRAIEISELARTIDPALLADLDSTPTIAARAAIAIGRTKRPEGAQPLRVHLASNDVGVRATCAYALGLLSDADSLQPLRDLVRHDASSAVRYAAADAIGRIVAAHPALADHSVASDLLIVTRTDADPIVRGHAAAQLDAFHGTDFARSIETALERVMQREVDEGVRWHTMWTIARGFAPLADRLFLSQSLHDPNEVVRLEAARAWGRRTDPDAATVVNIALNDRSWRVQYEAREAIRRLTKLPPTEHLAEVPPTVSLPPIPPAIIASVSPPPSPIPGAQKLLAPDPTTFNLESFVAPTTAFGMNQGRPGQHERVLLRTTKGDLTIALYREWAPSTVANFLALAGSHYYDGNRWFRVVPDFVAQTGDPSDNGEGDAGYAIDAEENPIEERSGVIAMGLNYDKNMPIRDSAGTQFYITLSPQLHLDRDFTVFGEVTNGFDVLAHLVETDRIVSIVVLGES